MAEIAPDPRETAHHPRLAHQVLGHDGAIQHFLKSTASGKLHHAWMISGKPGIGKATLAYKFAGYLLDGGQGADFTLSPDSRTAHWIAARAHPDLFVLERQWDGKTKKLKSELSVEDARKLSAFFGLTAGGGGWRVAIIDAADDLNRGSANALLKLIEEPPPNCLLLLVTNQPGRLLRTLRSRCQELPLSPLSVDQTLAVLHGLEEVTLPDANQIDLLLAHAGGSPGQFLALSHAEGAKAFAAFLQMRVYSPTNRIEFAARFTARPLSADDFNVFSHLLLDWVRGQALQHVGSVFAQNLASIYHDIDYSLRQTNALNLDKRQAILFALSRIDWAQKAASY